MATRKQRGARSVLEYKVDLDQSVPERAAAFLDWAAKKFPGRPISYEQIVKVVLALPRQPKEGSKDVEMFRKNRMSRVKQVLLEHYRRATVPHPGLGVRATTNSEDVARTDVERKARRAKSAAESLDKSISLVDPTQIKDREVRARFTNISQASKALNSPQILKRLELPPKKKED